MAGALLRFNFLDVLRLYGERFIQLHPLLHEYAREKLTHSNAYPQVYEHYLEVIPEWKAPALTVAPHIQDMLAALEALIARAEWLKAIRLLGQSFEILAAEGDMRRLEQAIRVNEETSESRLLKAALANLKGHLSLSIRDVILAQEQFELALRTGQGASLAPALEPVHLGEMGRALLGITRCLFVKKEHRAALDLLEDLYSKDIFLTLVDSGLKAERELLLGDIHVEMCDFRKALVCYQSVPQAGGSLERQAHCHRSLHETKRAIEIYSSLFAEPNHPADFRAGIGLGLADSLIEDGQISEALQMLDEVESILRQDAHFARLWKYRALAAREKSVVLECARRSLDYWLRVPDSEVEEKQMQDLVTEIEREME